MKEEVQIIERNGKPEWATLPYEEYLQLLEQAELLEDVRDSSAKRTFHREARDTCTWRKCR